MIAALLLAAVLQAPPPAPQDNWRVVTVTPTGARWELNRVGFAEANGLISVSVRSISKEGSTLEYSFFVRRAHCDKPYGDVMLTGAGIAEAGTFARGANTMAASLAAAACKLANTGGALL